MDEDNNPLKERMLMSSEVEEDNPLNPASQEATPPLNSESRSKDLIVHTLSGEYFRLKPKLLRNAFVNALTRENL